MEWGISFRASRDALILLTKRIGVEGLERISSRLVARKIGNLGTGTHISDARFKNDSSIFGPSALHRCLTQESHRVRGRILLLSGLHRRKLMSVCCQQLT
jgi:hypothetical protein